jgi:hypothetical protein
MQQQGINRIVTRRFREKAANELHDDSGSRSAAMSSHLQGDRKSVREVLLLFSPHHGENAHIYSFIRVRSGAYFFFVLQTTTNLIFTRDQ